MTRYMKHHYKDLATLALIGIIAFYCYTTVRSWIVWQQNINQSIQVIAIYMQRDNPSALKSIINPGASNENAQAKRQVIPPAKTEPASPGGRTEAAATGEEAKKEK